MKENIIVDAKDLIKTFKDGKVETRVLKGVNLKVHEGEFVAIMGRSGAGKSTCMYQLSLLDEPTSGEIKLLGKNTEGMSREERTKFRLYNLGYVFQDYSLIPELTALENIMIPLLQQGVSTADAKSRAMSALVSVNMGHRPDNRPPELSGGEQQRVSIARAICHKPKLLFADEPTANLDLNSSGIVMEIFKKLNKEDGLTIVMVTHEDEYGAMCDRIIRMQDGTVV